MEFIVETHPNDKDMKLLEQKLLQYNCSKTTDYRYEDILIKTESSQSMIAAIHGQIGGCWLYVAGLWVDEKFRGRAIGTKLLQLLEDFALSKGCTGVYLYTYSFQNPGFYSALGYEVFGELQGFCETETKYFMKKSLR